MHCNLLNYAFNPFNVNMNLQNQQSIQQELTRKVNFSNLVFRQKYLTQIKYDFSVYHFRDQQDIWISCLLFSLSLHSALILENVNIRAKAFGQYKMEKGSKLLIIK